MEVSDFPSIDPNIDYEKILPIHQKRIIAFINHFITNTVSFLNTFSQSCESRLMEFDYKIQRVEASLLILESQLASISGLNSVNDSVNNREVETNVEKDNFNTIELPEIIDEKAIVAETNVENKGIKASDDPTYKRFFKMSQVGVPIAAIKQKMEIEGLDSNILDNPDSITSIENVSSEHGSSNNST